MLFMSYNIVFFFLSLSYFVAFPVKLLRRASMHLYNDGNLIVHRNEHQYRRLLSVTSLFNHKPRLFSITILRRYSHKYR